MKNKLIRNCLAILTASALVVPAGIPVYAATPDKVSAAQMSGNETPDEVSAAQMSGNETPGEVSAAQMSANETPDAASAVQMPGDEMPGQATVDVSDVPQDKEKADEQGGAEVTPTSGVEGGQSEDGKLPQSEGTKQYTVTGQAAGAVRQEDSDRTAAETAHNAAASEANIQIGDQTYPTLAEAVAAAKDGDVLKLMANIEQLQTVPITKAITLDLNGFTITTSAQFKGNFLFSNRGTLTITGDGAIDASAGTYPLIAINNGKDAVFNMDSGKITGHGVVQNVGGIVNLTGGTLTATERNTALSQLGELHISGTARLSSTGEGISAVQALGAKVTVSENAVLTGNGGIDVFNSNRNEADSIASEVEITGGVIETADFPVSGNNQESAGANVTITGGTLKNTAGGTSIYWPMEGTLTVGGNAVIEGGTGIEAKMGTIMIKDNAVITGTGAWKEDKPENGGSSPEGSAFLGTTQMYDGCRNDSSLIVNIVGGTLQSVNGNAVTVYNTEEKSEVKAEIFVSGGSLQPAEGKGTVKVITSGENTTQFDTESNTFDTMKSNTTVKVSNHVSSAATDEDGKTTYYNTVEEALKANVETGNAHIFVNAPSSVTSEAIEGENIILTVAPNVELDVSSGVEGMIVKETVNEDGSKTYELVDAEELAPPKNVTVTTENKTVHIGETIILKAAAEHESDQVTYEYKWYKDGVVLEGQTTSELTLTESGDYVVEVCAILQNDGMTLTSESVKSSPVRCTVTPHEYEEKWNSDQTNHWHECTICKEKKDLAAHTFGEWKVTLKATDKKDGRKERICSVCGHKETAVIKAVGTTEKPKQDTQKPASVKTGDESNPTVYVFYLMLTSGLIAVLAAVNRRKRF